MRVAVVGTGRMGSAMARSLARGGSDLILQNRTAERAEALANELGASTVATPAEAAAAADVVITMLENQAAVESTWSGPDGLLAGARSGVVLVDMSTVQPSVIQSFASAAAIVCRFCWSSPIWSRGFCCSICFACSRSDVARRREPSVGVSRALKAPPADA